MPNGDELLKYYIRHADKRFDELDKKVDKLISLRWMLIGAASGASVVVSVCFEVARAFGGLK